jgi:ferric-dicitrate binding protein FerR (iron transport regulator)
MEHKEEDIRSLMIEKLDNAIAPEDDLLLQQLIAEQKKVRHLWEEMQGIFTTGEGKRLIENTNVEEGWGTFSNELQKARRKKIIRLTVLTASAAAAIIAVLLGTYAYWPGNRSGNNAVTAKAGKAILLQLEDGKTINLSDTTNTAIIAGDARLHNSDNTLSYLGGKATQWSKLTVPAGMDYKIMLSDSSIVWLNAATTVHFPLQFTGNTREIEINGEAYIKVAKNPSRPFIVHLPHADVQVLGTEFNINSYDSGTVKVALVQGKVNLHTGHEAVELQPGYEGASSTGTPIKVNLFDQRQVLAWMKGQYMFSNATVQEIALILRRSYDLNVVVDNNAVAQKRFTGIINKYKKLTDFLDNLTTTAEVNYYFDGSVLHFK